MTFVTAVSNNMANLTTSLTANLTDLGGLPGEIEDQINKTNASDHTYRSVARVIINNLTQIFLQELHLCPDCGGGGDSRDLCLGRHNHHVSSDLPIPEVRHLCSFASYLCHKDGK